MALLSGCQEGKQTPKLTEVICPECGEVIEVFVRQGGNGEDAGRTRDDAVCDKCGYTIPDGSKIGDYKLA